VTAQRQNVSGDAHLGERLPLLVYFAEVVAAPAPQESVEFNFSFAEAK
jgi:hypothetical protein